MLREHTPGVDEPTPVEAADVEAWLAALERVRVTAWAAGYNAGLRATAGDGTPWWTGLLPFVALAGFVVGVVVAGR